MFQRPPGSQAVGAGLEKPMMAGAMQRGLAWTRPVGEQRGQSNTAAKMGMEP